MGSRGWVRTASSSSGVHRRGIGGSFGGCLEEGKGCAWRSVPGCFPFPRFPSPPGAWGWKRFERGAVLVSVGRLDGVSGLDEFVEGGADGLGAHSGGLADLASGEGFAGLGEDGADALSGPGVGRCRRCGFRPDELQGRPLGGGCEFEAEIVEVGCGAVVGGEKDALLATAQDEHVIRPREELGAAPESLSGSSSATFSRVVDDEYCALEAALQVAQAVEDGRDLADGVLVGAVEADEGVEDEQAGADALDGIGEALLVSGIVESEGGGIDDVEVEVGERGAAGGCDPVEAAGGGCGGRPRRQTAAPVRPGSGSV